MADIKSPEERSLNMSKIRSKDTKPEEYIRKKLFSMGIDIERTVHRYLGILIYGCPNIMLPYS